MRKNPPAKARESKKQRDHNRQQTHHVRAFRLGDGLPNLTVMRNELLDMTDVLMGREEPPINAGVSTLLEVADAYFARASEMTMLLQQAEREGTVQRGSAHYKFRTGELRTFMDMAKRASELGSRRITYRQLQIEAERLGRGGPRRDTMFDVY